MRETQDLVTIIPWTFIAQICNLFIQCWLIKKFLFKPVCAIIEKRRALADSQIQDAKKAKEEAAAMKADYEAEMAKAKETANSILQNAQKDAAARSEAMIQEAQTQAAGIKAKRGISYYVRVYSYKLLKKLHVSTRMGSEDFQNASLIMKGVLCSCVNEDIQDELKNITCETLLVWGEYDTQTPLSMGKIMEEKIPNATLIVLKKQDHFAYFYQSQRFLRICEAFLYA